MRVLKRALLKVAAGSLKGFRGDMQEPLFRKVLVSKMDQSIVRIPDSKIAKEATQLLLEISPVFLSNHCFRTYVFGDLLGQKEQLKYDRELFYLAALLHDLGLTERFDGNESFEIDGANAAHAFLIKHGLPLDKAALVREAIALHLSVIAEQRQPEIALVHRGAGLDVSGSDSENIAPAILAQVLAVYPRLGLKQALLTMCLSQAERKPASTVARMFQQGLAQRISNAPFED